MLSLPKLYRILYETYGPQGWWPVREGGRGEPVYRPGRRAGELSLSQKFEIAVGAILTQNTAWTNVTKALVRMAEEKLLSKKAIQQAPVSTLAHAIRSSGYYNQKAKKLKALAEFPGPWTRGNLLKIWGLGPETVDSILLYARGRPVFVVDAYTRRILSRLGILASLNTEYHAVQGLFQTALDPDEMVYGEFHALFVELGKRHCRKVPRCAGCPLRKKCASAGQSPGAI